MWEPGREAGPLDGLSAQFQAEPSAYRQLLTGNQLAGTALPPGTRRKAPLLVCSPLCLGCGWAHQAPGISPGGLVTLPVPVRAALSLMFLSSTVFL